MNIRKIVTYNSLRKQFTAEELALAEALYNMTDAERDLLVGSLQPQKAATKRKAKGKSARASSLADAIKSSPKPREPICTTCGNVEDYVDHSEPSPSYHPF